MAVRYCSQCGTPQRPDARFCGTCGTPSGSGVLAAADGADTTDAMGLGYAGFWLRFLALFIDGIVVSIVTNPFVLAIGWGLSGEVVEDASGEITSFTWNVDVDPTRIVIVSIISIVVPAVYYIVAVSRWGQTLGALAVSVRVQHPDGSLLSPGAAAVRWVGAFVSAIPLYLGYFWMIWDRHKQTWHDKFAGSVVVKVKRRGEL
jgi:uncharacterized RDD family membrane protein YckC